MQRREELFDSRVDAAEFRRRRFLGVLCVVAGWAVSMSGFLVDDYVGVVVMASVLPVAVSVGLVCLLLYLPARSFWDRRPGTLGLIGALLFLVSQVLNLLNWTATPLLAF